MASVGITSLALVACSRPVTEEVRPLDAGRTDVAAPTDDHRATVDPAPPTTAAPTGAADVGASSDGTDPDGDAVAAVADLLSRFDRSLGELHSDPSVLLRPDDPVLADLAGVVPSGAVLADDVRSQVLDRLSRGESIPAAAGMEPYVHHAVTAAFDGTDRIEFTWCGWSPGVVVDSATGAVVDDVVGHGTGTGVAERFDGRWMLSSLDETSYEALTAGSPDPCPGGRQ